MKKLIHNILLEGRVEDVYTKFKTGIDDERNNHGDDASVYDIFVRSNFMSETNYKYLHWCMDVWYNYKNGTDQTYDYEDLLHIIEDFHNNITRIKNKDINSYKTITDLNIVVSEAIEKSEEKNKLKSLKKETVKIYEDDDFLVIKPLTYESSCSYGGGTKWCTASRETDEHFKSYTRTGDLFYVIDKKRTKEHPLYKMAVHVRNGNIRSAVVYNAPDTKISDKIEAIFPKNIIKAIETGLKIKKIVDPKQLFFTKLQEGLGDGSISNDFFEYRQYGNTHIIGDMSRFSMLTTIIKDTDIDSVSVVLPVNGLFSNDLTISIEPYIVLNTKDGDHTNVGLTITLGSALNELEMMSHYILQLLTRLELAVVRKVREVKNDY